MPQGHRTLTDSWRLGCTSPNSYWQAPPLTMWWLQPCVLLLLLPSMRGGWDSSQGIPLAGKQVLQAEGRVLLWPRSASLICFDEKEWPLWNMTHADLGGKIHNQSWVILVQINGNYNFTFHTGTMQNFYCAAKTFFSHQQTQDYHRPPRKSLWSTVYSSRLHRLHPKF